MPDQRPFLAPLLQRLLDHAKSTIPIASFKPSVNDNINNIYWLFRKKESAVDLSGSAALMIFSRFRDEVLSSIGRSCGALSNLKRPMSSHPRDVGENHTQVSTSCPMLLWQNMEKTQIKKSYYSLEGFVFNPVMHHLMNAWYMQDTNICSEKKENTQQWKMRTTTMSTICLDLNYTKRMLALISGAVIDHLNLHRRQRVSYCKSSMAPTSLLEEWTWQVPQEATC